MAAKLHNENAILAIMVKSEKLTLERVINVEVLKKFAEKYHAQLVQNGNN